MCVYVCVCHPKDPKFIDNNFKLYTGSKAEVLQKENELNDSIEEDLPEPPPLPEKQASPKKKTAKKRKRNEGMSKINIHCTSKFLCLP